MARVIATNHQDSRTVAFDRRRSPSLSPAQRGLIPTTQSNHNGPLRWGSETHLLVAIKHGLITPPTALTPPSEKLPSSGESPLQDGLFPETV